MKKLLGGLMLLSLLCYGCAKPPADTGQAPEPMPAPDMEAASEAGATADPATEPEGETTTESTIAKENLPLVEAARKALLEAKAAIEAKEFAKATEQFSVAAESLEALKPKVEADAEATATLETMLGKLTGEQPGTAEEVDQLLKDMKDVCCKALGASPEDPVFKDDAAAPTADAAVETSPDDAVPAGEGAATE